jgi:hypothetical protein
MTNQLSPLKSPPLHGKVAKSALWLLALVGALALSGCKSLDQSAFQDFSTAAEKINSSAKDAYDLLAKADAERQRQKLVTNTLPPFAPPNRPILRGQTQIRPESIQERLRVTAGLAAYAKALANLASGPAAKQFDTSTANLAQSLKDFTSENVTNLFGVNLARNLPTSGQITAFSDAIKMLGDLILEAETKRSLSKVLDRATPAIWNVTTNLENDIGFATTTQGLPAEGMRGYFSGAYEKRLLTEFGQNQWTTADGTTLKWADLSVPERKQMVADATSLVEEEESTDALLVALRDSYGKFRQAHEALKDVVKQSNQFSISAALSNLNQAAQRLDDIVKSLNQTTTKGS